ncbi:uracil-DNA glycosylase family protein [Hyphomicrobium nitrativorans]|uniref:uracil-DNA glycosylase family protein n=1 Tax=Hyphomicrobium nitrativorans TaxID=1427356 RepID=UPI001FCAE68C|nr:uracil-DNA glycosylase family protein [Hyphomicrobium nitrativorans]
MRPDTDNRALLTLLAWYQEMGVDAAVSDAAVNWLDRGDAAPGRGFRLSPSPADQETGQSLSPTPPRAPAANPAPAPRQGRIAPPRESIGDPPGRAPSTPTARPFAGAPAEAAERAARQAARDAADLDALEATLRQFDGCGLKATAKNLCFYRGAKQSRLMIVGEAPGRDEDLAGLPFVGRAGQLLDKDAGRDFAQGDRRSHHQRRLLATPPATARRPRRKAKSAARSLSARWNSSRLMSCCSSGARRQSKCWA